MLASVATSDLESLLRKLERGTIPFPLSGSILESSGFPSELASAFTGLDANAACAVIRAVLEERAHARTVGLELAWTGPEAKGAIARETAAIVRELFDQAEKSVLIGGFRFDHGKKLLRPLADAMARGVEVLIVIDIPGNAPAKAAATSFATAKIDAFFRDNWPSEEHRPDVYYDPRTAYRTDDWASMHAKCVVVDERRSFITSANFTNRGQTRNIELGVVIDDEAFAKSVVRQWQTLIAAALLHRYDG